MVPAPVSKPAATPVSGSHPLVKQIQEDEKKVAELNRKIEELNSKINDLRNQKASCETLKTDIESRIAAQRHQLEQEAKSDKHQQVLELKNALAKLEELKRAAAANEEFAAAATYKKQMEALEKQLQALES